MAERKLKRPPGRHHPHRQHLRGFGYLRSLGPGLITGAADDDPSGIGTYSQVGAAFGFGMLWTALVTLPLAGAVQETAARLGLASGKGLAGLIREHFPRWILYAAVLLVSVANVFNIGADIGAMAASIQLLVPIPHAPLVLAVAAGILTLEVFMPYRSYARILRWLCLSLVAYIVVLAFIPIDWGDVLRSTFFPSLRMEPIYIAGVIAVFGTTISPYLFFWQASEEVEEEIAHHEVGPVDAKHIRAMRIDTASGMASAVIVAFSIMVASGATLHANGITMVETPTQAAQALKPLAGNIAGLLFALGIIGTGALGIPVLAGSTGYALAEAFGWREGLSEKLRQAPGFYAAIVVAMAVGLAMNFVGTNPIRALYYAAILNGVTAAPLILLMLILANSRSVVGEHRSGWISNVLVTVALVVMAALPVLYFLVG